MLSTLSEPEWSIKNGAEVPQCFVENECWFYFLCDKIMATRKRASSSPALDSCRIPPSGAA